MVDVACECVCLGNPDRLYLLFRGSFRCIFTTEKYHFMSLFRPVRRGDLFFRRRSHTNKCSRQYLRYHFFRNDSVGFDGLCYDVSFIEISDQACRFFCPAKKPYPGHWDFPARIYVHLEYLWHLFPADSGIFRKHFYRVFAKRAEPGRRFDFLTRSHCQLASIKEDHYDEMRYHPAHSSQRVVFI